MREIARQIGRSPATISRELRRNAATRSGKLEHRALVAQWKPSNLPSVQRWAKLMTNVALRGYVQGRLAGIVRHRDARSQRPVVASARAVLGHWEGDLIIVVGRSAIGNLAERRSRTTLLMHLPRQQDWGEQAYVKNGLALGGYGAVAMNAGWTVTMASLPQPLRKTLTWDRGKELSAHAQFAMNTGDAGVFRRSAFTVAATVK